jgi:hypothetical protein
MSDNIEPGGYILKKAELSNFSGDSVLEIGNIITSIEIEEDIVNVCTTATIVITDALNVIDIFPIIGEEFLILEIQDFFEEVATYEFHVVSIDNIIVNSEGTAQVYSMRLYTKDFVKSESVEISQSYKGKLSESVKSIYDALFISEKEIEIEETIGEHTLVVPNLTPIETILLMAAKSFSDVYRSSNYLFFERKDKYFFGTHEKLFNDGQKTDKKYYYSLSQEDIETKQKQMYKIQTFSVNKRFNLLKEMRSGAAISRVIKLDLATKTYENIDYKHYEKVKDYTHTDSVTKDYHTTKFNEEFFSEENITNKYLVYQDSTRQDQPYQDTVSQRRSVSYYLNGISLYMNLYGANNLNLGDLVRLELQEFSGETDNTNLHKTLSGLYMVANIKSDYDGERWSMTVGLLKDALKGEGAE